MKASPPLDEEFVAVSPLTPLLGEVVAVVAPEEPLADVLVDADVVVDADVALADVDELLDPEDVVLVGGQYVDLLVGWCLGVVVSVVVVSAVVAGDPAVDVVTVEVSPVDVESLVV